MQIPLNAQRAKELMNSDIWKSFCMEVDSRVYLTLQEMKICAPEKLAVLQERVKALESVKNIPQDVVDRE